MLSINALLTKHEVKMAGFWSSSLLPFYEPIWSSGQQKHKKEINNNNKVNIQLSWLNKLGQLSIAKAGNPEGGIIGQSGSQDKSFHEEGYLSWRLVGCCFPSFSRRKIGINKVNLSSFQLKTFFKFALAWVPRAQQNILTLQPCLHTLMQTHLSANQSGRTIFCKRYWSFVSLSKHLRV